MNIEVITQNCFFGKKVKEAIGLIRSHNPDICCLQETGTYQFIDQVRNGTNYDAVVSEAARTFIPGIFVLNAIFTQLEIVDRGEFNWTKSRMTWIESFGGKCIWGTLRKDDSDFRVYNCYFSVVDQGMVERQKMLKEILGHANEYQGPAIICGDMNTVIPDVQSLRWLVQLWHRFPTPPADLGEVVKRNEKYIFLQTANEYGFDEASEIDWNTWRMLTTGRESFNLKLDWMLYRNLTKDSCKLGEWVGDHKAIIANFHT